jgi:hypothetical protein
VEAEHDGVAGADPLHGLARCVEDLDLLDSGLARPPPRTMGAVGGAIGV